MKKQLREVENFKATASHELRTPIKMCIFFIDCLIKLLSSLPLGDKLEEVVSHLEMIRGQLALMECFAEDILSYNMIQSGAFTLKPVNFDLEKVLDFIRMTF